MNIADLVSMALSNDVFTGVAGGSLVAGGLYTLKSVPGTLWDFAKWRFTSELVVFNEDPAFDVVSDWLASLDYTKRARRLRMTTTRREEELLFSPGLGHHLLWHQGRPVLVRRFVPDNTGTGGSSWKRREDITIRTLGTTPSVLHSLIDRIMEARAGAHRTTVEIHMYSGYWRLACRKDKRRLDSVVMPPAQRDSIVRDLERFIRSREWYARRGVPYRRGVLFHGPPGCGKTSLVVAIAGHLGRSIYALNLGSLKNDEELIEAVTTVPESAILLIEDIDAAQAKRMEIDPKSEEKAKGITLSALLNAIDGVFAREGRILFMTTNHPERLDPALCRAGRADLDERIDLIDGSEISTMCRQFIESDLAAARVARSVKGPISPAELQKKLLRLRDDDEISEAEAAE